MLFQCKNGVTQDRTGGLRRPDLDEQLLGESDI